MPQPITLSIDAMGGDDAPDMVIEGIALARKELPNTRYIIFGRSGEVAPLLEKYAGLSDVCELRNTDDVRSEEHTSELQSHHDIVCRLLLEKKKQKQKRTTRHRRWTK